MASVLQLTRKLVERPPMPSVAGITLRHYQGPADIAVWLDLRRRAFARQSLGVRDWSPSEFQREILDKPWWNPRHLWFAEAQPLLMPAAPIGTVILARRGDDASSKAVVHWLAVLGSYRRRGIGRLLMAALETAAWDAGDRQVWLETHTQWAEAGQMYQRLGYRPCSAAGD